MTAVLRRLQSQIGYTLQKDTGNGLLLWNFGDFLAQQKTNYFEPLVRSHVVLDFEYSVFCSKLANDLMNKNSLPASIASSEKELNERVATALVLSELLAHIYRDYLSVPREVARLEEEQKIYRTWLKHRGYQFTEKEEPKIVSAPGFFTQKVRDTTVLLNWPRLFSGRIRRVFITSILLPEVKNLQYFYRFVVFADQFANPALTYFSWIFYVPRLMVNLVLLLKHLIPGAWMDDKEKELSGFTRLQAQLQRRWFELGNDAVWLTGGLLNCFVLTGALSPIGMYLTISFFLFDALWAGLRAYIELGRLNELERHYRGREAQLHPNEESSQAEIAEFKSYQQDLQRRMDFERQRLTLSVISTSALFLAMCLAMPILANPLLPFIAAVLVITITLITYLKVQDLEKQRPANHIMKLAQPQYAELLQKEGLFRHQGPTDSEDELDSLVQRARPQVVPAIIETTY